MKGVKKWHWMIVSVHLSTDRKHVSVFPAKHENCAALLVYRWRDSVEVPLPTQSKLQLPHRWCRKITLHRCGQRSHRQMQQRRLPHWCRIEHIVNTSMCWGWKGRNLCSVLFRYAQLLSEAWQMGKFSFFSWTVIFPWTHFEVVMSDPLRNHSNLSLFGNSIFVICNSSVSPMYSQNLPLNTGKKMVVETNCGVLGYMSVKTVGVCRKALITANPTTATTLPQPRDSWLLPCSLSSRFLSWPNYAGS